MSFKAKITATAASVALASGMGLASTMTASAATPSCGNNCISLFNQKFGHHYVTDVWQNNISQHAEITDWYAGSNDPALDFTYAFQGTVHQLYKAHLVSAAFDLHYGSDPAIEIEASPNGANSGLCQGTWPGEIAQTGFKVRLEPCGADGGTVWALDLAHKVNDSHSALGFDVPLINGTDVNFSHPMVMNYGGNSAGPVGTWTTVSPEASYSSGTVFNNQEWGVLVGQLP